jgi:hypothetical protein
MSEEVLNEGVNRHLMNHLISHTDELKTKGVDGGPADNWKTEGDQWTMSTKTPKGTLHTTYDKKNETSKHEWLKENTNMTTPSIVDFLNENDALGFTQFLKNALLEETQKQLAEGVINHHKEEETAAGHKAGDATSMTNGTTATKKATPAMGEKKPLEDGKGGGPGKGTTPMPKGKPLAEQIEELKAQVQKALSESNTVDAAAALTALDEALVNKAKEDEIAASKAAGNATSKTTATDPGKTATPAMAVTKPLHQDAKGNAGTPVARMADGKPVAENAKGNAGTPTPKMADGVPVAQNAAKSMKGTTRMKDGVPEC